MAKTQRAIVALEPFKSPDLLPTAGDLDLFIRSRTFSRTTATEPACRMEYKFNAVPPHSHLSSRAASAARNIPPPIDMASRRGVSKRPPSSEGQHLSYVPADGLGVGGPENADE